MRDVRLLIAEDDREVAGALEAFFSSEGSHVTLAFDGEQALQMLSSKPGFDVVLLDLGLPRKDGFEVLDTAQHMGVSCPVLVVTVSGERDFIQRGFGLGASDYIVKPFDVEDLRERVCAVLGNSPGSEQALHSVQIGEVRIDFDSGKGMRGAQPIEFEELELELLRSLLRRRGQVVTRKRLVRDAWGMDPDTALFTVAPEVVAKTLDRHINSIRTKIEPNPHLPRIIETVYGLGYRLKLPTT